MTPIDLGPFDPATFEPACRARWDEAGVHTWHPPAPGDAAPVFAVDTPPPYVSAAHLHVGHAMSYTQAEIVVRYRRMSGDRVFYPMGFDDNGLPTERYVEKARGLDPRATPRATFLAACLEETARGASAYEALWRALGLSVDWSLRYSTIDAHCRRTAQRSFLDLHGSGRIYRADAPVAWDPTLGTALAQADLELVTRWTKLHTITFRGDDGRALSIATTRPELLPACVALYHHPDDTRYTGIRAARVPLFGHEVPVRADADVDPAYGTGLMMVCTFGDADDVRRWRRDALPMRALVMADGTLGALGGPYAGLAGDKAREAIVRDLAAADAYEGFRRVEQRVPVSERTQAPIEWRAVPSWFVRIVDLQDRLLTRSAELRWHPPFMKERLDAWIAGLSHDWNISRQRTHGVPFPVWACAACGRVVLAEAAQLPVDPVVDRPPVERCPGCGGPLVADPDVMDTWMTSSLTPFINANTAGTPGRSAGPFPATVRVQAFEIVRTWLFYTLVKAELHRGCLPFRDVMISGWGLDEQGRKISKRNLEATPEDGFNRYDPAHLIARFGADAVRHWAARTALGRDLRFSLSDVKAGRKVGIKLWNAMTLALDLLADFDPSAPRAAMADRAPEDRELLHAFDGVLAAMQAGLDAYDYASGLFALDRWFFDHLCDDWLEAAKERIRRPGFSAENRTSAQATAWEVLRATLGAYAPYLPFVTDTLWARVYAGTEPGVASIHASAFPAPFGADPAPGMALVGAVRGWVRRWRTERALPQSRRLAEVEIAADPADAALLEGLRPALLAACRADAIAVTAAAGELAVQVRAEG